MIGGAQELGACSRTHATRAGMVAARPGASSRAAEAGVPTGGHGRAAAGVGRVRVYTVCHVAGCMRSSGLGGDGDGREAGDDDAEEAAAGVTPPLADASGRRGVRGPASEARGYGSPRSW